MHITGAWLLAIELLHIDPYIRQTKPITHLIVLTAPCCGHHVNRRDQMHVSEFTLGCPFYMTKQVKTIQQYSKEYGTCCPFEGLIIH